MACRSGKTGGVNYLVKGYFKQGKVKTAMDKVFGRYLRCAFRVINVLFICKLLANLILEVNLCWTL